MFTCFPINNRQRPNQEQGRTVCEQKMLIETINATKHALAHSMQYLKQQIRFKQKTCTAMKQYNIKAPSNKKHV